MSWRVTGIEQLDATEQAEGRTPRHVDARWDGGLVIDPGSEWVIAKLRAIDGQDVGLYPLGDAPVFTVDVGDEAACYWAVCSLLDLTSITATNPPPRTWTEEPLEPGAVN